MKMFWSSGAFEKEAMKNSSVTMWLMKRSEQVMKNASATPCLGEEVIEDFSCFSFSFFFFPCG
jgi:hypothetical protein